MKKTTLCLVAILSAFLVLAQSPQAFKYQAVVHDNTGEILAEQNVSFQISILEGSISGIAVYIETHDTITNEFGLVNLEIGNGSVFSGVFADINWGTNIYFIQVEMDENGEDNYQLMGTSQILSVPHSLNSSSLTLTSPSGITYEVNVDDSGNLSTNCFPMPTVADAGPDQVNVISPTTLYGNTPVVGTGQWTIESGTGGNITEPSNPTSSFSGIANTSYTLRWTISTIYDTTFDDVIISFTESLSCPATCTDIDGNTYNTVLMGDQCWMKENLKTTTYRNGTPIPNITEDIEWQNTTSGAYAWYVNDIFWKDKYGALYNWYTMVDPNGLCPTGWSVPTHDEWTTLTDFIGGTGEPHGDELKSCRQVNSPLGGGCTTSEHPRWNVAGTQYGTDDYGFSGLPGGYRFDDGTFLFVGNYGCWWSSTEYLSSYAWLRNLSYNDGIVFENYFNKPYGFSVRCLRD